MKRQGLELQNSKRILFVCLYLLLCLYAVVTFIVEKTTLTFPVIDLREDNNTVYNDTLNNELGDSVHVDLPETSNNTIAASPISTTIPNSSSNPRINSTLDDNDNKNITNDDNDKENSEHSLSSSSTTRISDSKIVILVISSRRGIERRNAIRETWARGHSNVYFIVGASACPIPPRLRTTTYECTVDTEKETLMKNADTLQQIQTEWKEEVDIEEKVLQKEALMFPDLVLVPMVDSYNALPRKIKEMYRWALNNTKAEWIVKIDDDAVARIPQLEQVLSEIDLNHDKDNKGDDKYVVIGHIRKELIVPKEGKWAEFSWPDLRYPTFANGAQGYAASRSVAKAVVKHDGFEYQGEDTSQGIWLYQMQKNVDWIHAPQRFHFVPNGDCSQKDAIVIGHEFSPEKMRACFPRSRRLKHILDDLYWSLVIQ